MLYYTVSVTIKVIKGGVRKPMEFSNRNTQPQAAAPSTHTAAAGAAGGGKKGKARGGSKLNKLAVLIGTVLMAILLIAVIVFAVNAPGKKESSYVDSSKLQAVFLNTGQVYFGNVTSMNNQYIVLTNIYYLQTAQSGNNNNANSSVSLVKLGCELHEPYDKMVINRDQVTFWENLQDSGQVATAVKTFEKQNPDGQKCADQSSSAGTNTGNNAQSAGSSNSNNSTTTSGN